MMKRIALVAVLMFGHATSAWAGFDEGMAVYERGDYATALEEWLPLANGGDASAGYNLGVMYDHGQGVPQDYAEAVKWYRLAAERGGRSAIRLWRNPRSSAATRPCCGRAWPSPSMAASPCCRTTDQGERR